MEQVLYAGFGRQNITPDYSVPLAGYGATHKRMSTVVLSEIFATCIAFRQGDETILLFSQDLIRTNEKWIAPIRERVSSRTGVPVDRILVCSTHTHSAPDVYSGLDCMKEYFNTLYLDALEKAAVEALEDLAPATLYGTRTQTEGMNFVRHYLLENGTYAGPNFGDFKSAPIVDHAAPNDPELLMVKLERQEKPAILIANFQVHPTATGGGKNTVMSADFVGVTRDNVEAATGMHFAYFTGAAGNQVLGTRLPKECDNMTADQCRKFGRTHYIVYGWRLAQYILKALPTLKPMASQKMAIARTDLEYATNREDLHLVEPAKRMREIWNEEGMAAAKAYGVPLGISSVYHAGAIISRQNRDEKGSMELDAVRIGDFSFVTMPYEAFGAHGVYVKENSPFPMTMIFSCANGGWNYIPTKEAYDYGCYESFTSYFAKGAGEAAAEKLTDMLHSLK